MPRDAGGNYYYLPPGTEAEPDTIIESARYNVFTQDVEDEFNRILDQFGVGLVYVSDTPPIGVHDGSFWFEADTGLLFFLYNDGNSTQWCITSPQPDMTAFVKRAGDTMTGFLSLNANPTAPLHAATKQYADNAAFPAGTVMLFYQTAAPTGWTIVSTQNNKALRVVSSNGGVAGGTNAFSTVFAQTTTGNTTLTAATVPNLNVSVSGTVSVSGSVSGSAPWVTSGMAVTAGGTSLAYANGSTAIGSSGSMSGSNSMTGATTGASGGAHSHPITMAIQYIDVILASKN